MKQNKKQQTFADSLTRGMSNAGYTDETLAEKIGYNPDTIYRWRTDKVTPSKRAQKACLQAITQKI